jgi:hypothetical protein
MRKTTALLIILAFGIAFFSSCGGSQKSKEIVISELTEPCDLAKAMVTFMKETFDLYNELDQIIEKVGDREPTPSEESRAEAIVAQIVEIESKVNELMIRSDELGITDEELEACPENEELLKLFEGIEFKEGLFY